MKILRIKIEFRGKRRILRNRTAVFIANHQSFFDLIIFGAIVPKNTLIIGKKSLIWFPLFGWVFYLAGNLYLNRKNHQKAMGTMKTVDVALQEGSSLWIFPEGTRSHGRGLKSFKKGGFYAALQNQVPLQPLVVSTFKNALDFSKWSPGRVVVEVLDAIPTHGHGMDDISDIMDKAYNVMKNRIAFLDKELK
ncbi:lysophospholipid acyltransferase family protein [Silvanigrella aquatica]|nr:lysophospholipid acyltransferase family protein [Silvanigrella aquatica]